MILDNGQITIRLVADNVSISFASCQAILTDVFDMKHAAANINPQLLNCKQKQRRMDITKEILSAFNNYSDLLKKFITGNESWGNGYDIKTIARSS